MAAESAASAGAAASAGEGAGGGVLERLVAAGLSNRAIAEQLVLALSTVKWYLKELYRKLDVHSRTAAVARARTLGLLG